MSAQSLAHYPRDEKVVFQTTKQIAVFRPVANGIGQTSTAYTLNRGVANVGVEEVRQTDSKRVKVIHTLPVMTDAERDLAKKRIGNDLYEILMRIQAELQLDSEIFKK